MRRTRDATAQLSAALTADVAVATRAVSRAEEVVRNLTEDTMATSSPISAAARAASQELARIVSRLEEALGQTQSALAKRTPEAAGSLVKVVIARTPEASGSDE